MQVSVETISTLGRRVTIAVPAERLEQAFGDRLKRMSREAKIPGFRPGKVPLKVIEARFGERLIEEAAGDIIQSTLSEAIGAQGLKPVSGTRVQRKPLARGQNLEYTAEFEIYPEIARLDLAGITIERLAPTISADDIERTLDSIRRQRVTWNPVLRPAQSGDRLHIDFVGRLLGQEFEDAKAEGHAVVLGGGALLKDLEEGLIGAATGETRTIAVKFPSGQRDERLAGQTLDFEVKINDIAEPVLPELNDELAKQLGTSDGTVDTLRAEVRGTLEREAQARARAMTRKRVLHALLAANQFEVPASLVEAEITRMQQRAQAKPAGGAVDDPEAYRDRARTRVALGLVLAEVIRARGLRADPQAVRDRITRMAADYDKPEQFVEWYYADRARLGEVESMVLEEQAVEVLLASATVTEKAIGFQELLQLEA